MKRCFLVMACSIMVFCTHAQSLKGNWFGIGRVSVPGDHSHYLAEMVLQQKGKNINGTLQYYFRDSLFTVPLKGVFDATTRKLTLSPISIIFYRATSTRNGIDCIMYGNFTLIANKNESVLTGAFTSDAAHRYTVPDINVRFRYSTDTLPAPTINITEDDSVATEPTTLTVPTTSSDSTTRIDLKRQKWYVKEIEVVNPTLRIELYDNGTIDYDSVSLYLNNQLLLPKTKLDHKAIKLAVTLDSNLVYHELSMYAENLGLIPPNTAALILYDGTTRHELILTSDLNRTATLQLKRKGKQ